MPLEESLQDKQLIVAELSAEVVKVRGRLQSSPNLPTRAAGRRPWATYGVALRYCETSARSWPLPANQRAQAQSCSFQIFKREATGSLRKATSALNIFHDNKRDKMADPKIQSVLLLLGNSNQR